MKSLLVLLVICSMSQELLVAAAQSSAQQEKYDGPLFYSPEIGKIESTDIRPGYALIHNDTERPYSIKRVGSYMQNKDFREACDTFYKLYPGWYLLVNANSVVLFKTAIKDKVPDFSRGNFEQIISEDKTVHSLGSKKKTIFI